MREAGGKRAETLFHAQCDGKSQYRLPSRFVVSQLPAIISLNGDGSWPVSNVTLRNLIFEHTANTYMRPHRIPSGGDWSIHSSAAVSLSGTDGVVISDCYFTQLGSNAISLFGHNDGTIITRNEFAWLGQSGVILVGVTNGVYGVSTSEQPSNVHIDSNLFREFGIYIKQSAGIFHTVSRNISAYGNVMFNMPCAGALINDGF